MARPVGPVGRLRRWGRRNPWVAGLSAAVLLSLLLGTCVSLTLAFRAIRAESAIRQERDRAEAEAAISNAVSEFLQKDLLAQASAFSQAPFDTKPDPNLKVRTALDRAAQTIGERFATRPLVEAAVRLTIGETYFNLGLFPLARPHLERAIAIRRRVLGAKDPQTYNAMLSLGNLLRRDGRPTDSEPLLVPAMEGLRQARGAGHPETLQAMICVGELRLDQQRPADAEPLISRAMEGLRTAHGEGHIETLRAMHLLAMVYLIRQKPAQAENLLVEAVQRLRRKHGAENPNTLIAMCDSRDDLCDDRQAEPSRNARERRPASQAANPGRRASRDVDLHGVARGVPSGRKSAR